jgi:hypothetical protein
MKKASNIAMYSRYDLLKALRQQNLRVMKKIKHRLHKLHELALIPHWERGPPSPHA